MTDQECIKYLVGENHKLKTNVKQQGYELQRCYDFIRTLQHAVESAELDTTIKMYEHLYRGKQAKSQDAEEVTKQQMQETEEDDSDQIQQNSRG